MPHGGRGSIVRRKMRRAEKKSVQARERNMAAGAGSVLLSFPSPMTYVASCEMGVAPSPLMLDRAAPASMPDFSSFGLRVASDSNPMVEMVPIQLLQFVPGPVGSSPRASSSGPQTPPYMASSPRTSMNMLPTQMGSSGQMTPPYMASSPRTSMNSLPIGAPGSYFPGGVQLQVPSGPYFSQNSPMGGDYAQTPPQAEAPPVHTAHTLTVPCAACDGQQQALTRSVGWEMDAAFEESEEGEAAASSKAGLTRPLLESRATVVSESDFMTPSADKWLQEQRWEPKFFAEEDTPRREAEEEAFGRVSVGLQIKNTFVHAEAVTPRDSRRMSAPAW